QGVERRRRKHVHFVDDVDFEFRIGGHVFAGLPQLAHLLDTVVARAVDFQNVERTALGDLLAARVIFVEIYFWSVRAIEAFSENPGDRGLAGAARTAKEI